MQLVEQLRRGQVMRVPRDQLGSPTWAPDIGRALVALCRAHASGIFHVVGPERLNRYDFARAVAAGLGLNEELIDPVATAKLAQAAARPLSAGMSHSRLNAVLQEPMTPVRDSVAAIRRCMEAQA